MAGATEKQCGRLQRCSVVVESTASPSSTGQHVHVLVDIGLLGRQITVSREPRDDESVYVAIADAFRAARRQLHANRSQH